MSNEKTKAVTLSLTPTEEEELIIISAHFLGKSNKSGIVRRWMSEYKFKNPDWRDGKK